jgi:hypothetical protein
MDRYGLPIAVVAAVLLTVVVYSTFGTSSTFTLAPMMDPESSDRDRPLTHAELAGASPCVRSKLAEFLEEENPKVLRVYNLEVAESMCERDAKTQVEIATIERQRAVLRAAAEQPKTQ